jgi:hypothetical protein
VEASSELALNSDNQKKPMKGTYPIIDLAKQHICAIVTSLVIGAIVGITTGGFTTTVSGPELGIVSTIACFAVWVIHHRQRLHPHVNHRSHNLAFSVAVGAWIGLCAIFTPRSGM